MSFTINFSINNSPNNRAYKDLSLIATVEGVLKSATSITTPTVLIEVNPSTTIDLLSKANYAVIPTFNERHYFITDCRLYKNNLYEFDMRCDVLSTYIEELKTNTAIIRKQEKKWNLYLNDNSFKVYQNPMILTRAFPTGFTEHEYVLSIAGDR